MNPIPERRQSPRKKCEQLLYVDLEPGNGGMLLNFSEHGLCFRAARRVHPKAEVDFAFSLDDKRKLDGRGRLQWSDQDGRVAGLQFTDVSDELRKEIRQRLGGMDTAVTPKPLDATGSSSVPSPPAALQQESAAKDAAIKNRTAEPVALEPACPAPAKSLARNFAQQEVPWAAVTRPEDPLLEDVEERSTTKLTEHASALLKHMQHEEKRLLAEFCEAASRAVADSVQAQIKRLESAVAAAAVVSEQIGPLPARLERLQQQAIERFQLQTENVLRLHVEELRRRSELILEETNAGVRRAGSLPRRSGISTGLVAVGLVVVLAALLFSFWREAANAFIAVGERMSGEQPAATEPKATEEPLSTPTGALSAPKEQPQHARASQRDVKTLRAGVAKGDVAAEVTLGTMYLTGEGVTKNCFQARRLLSAAARKGNEEARLKLAQAARAGCS